MTNPASTHCNAFVVVVLWQSMIAIVLLLQSLYFRNIPWTEGFSYFLIFQKTLPLIIWKSFLTVPPSIGTHNAEVRQLCVEALLTSIRLEKVDC